MKLHMQGSKSIVISRIRLINWHWLSDGDTIPIDGSVFITGKNGSGKSTVLDAFRLLFLLQTIWKKKGQRSRPVESFVRGTINDEDASREDKAVGRTCKRPNKATTHVVAELYDMSSNRYTVIGVCATMEPIDDKAEVKWWYAENHKIDDFSLIGERDGKEVVQTIYEVTQQEGCGDIVVCKTMMEAKKKWSVLFGLTDNYVGDEKAFMEWVKIETAAISIDGKENVGNINQFIKSFVLQRSTEKIKQQQQEIEAFRLHYNRFSGIKKEMEARREEAAVLDELKRFYADYRKQESMEENLRIASGLVRQESLTADIQKEDMAWDAAKKTADALEEELEALQKEHDTYVQSILQLKNSDEMKALDGLQGQKEALAGRLEKAKKTAQELRRRTVNDVAPFVDAIDNVFGSPVIDMTFLRVYDDQNESMDQESTRTALKHLQDSMAAAKPKVQTFYQEKYNRRKEIEAEWRSVQDSIKMLEAGISSVDNASRMAAQVQACISKKFQAEHIQDTPVLLCDLMEYKDDSWAKAVEAYMGAYRYAIIVLPQNYLAAAKVYKEFCGQHQEIYGVTLVDTSALELNVPVLPDTLPAVFNIENPYAAAYVQFAYGTVNLVEDASAITRRQGTYLSKDGMRYSRYSLQRLRPVPHIVIGKKARRRMLEEFRRHRDDLNTELSETRKAEDFAKSVLDRFDSDRYHDFRRLSSSQLEETFKIPALKRELKTVTRDITRFHNSTMLQNLTDLESRRNSCDERRRALNPQLTNIHAEMKNHADAQAKKQEELNVVETEIAELEKNSPTAYNEAVQFWQELRAKTRKGPKAILQDFEQERQNIRDEKILLNERMSKQQKKFCDKVESDYDTEGIASMETYLQIAQKYSVTVLAKIQAQCAENEKTAYEYFKRSVLAGPKKEFGAAVDTLKKINAILKKMPFEDMVYSFAMPQAAPGYEDYFDMLFSDDNEERTDQISFMSRAFDDKYSDTRRRLFEELAKTDDIENCPLLNYLTYCQFDMQYTSTINPSVRGSVGRRGADGSTSEADVPCYITLAAALVQKWNRDNRSSVDITNPHALKIMMIDEAFFSMDVQRTKSIVSFIQDSLGIQMFCAAPPDKYGSIGYLMDGVIRMTNNSITHQRTMEYLPISEYEDIYDEDGDLRDIEEVAEEKELAVI